MARMEYRQQLLHPQWQRKRLQVMEHCGWKCGRCGDTETTLNIHHVEYRRGALAWEYELDEFECLCIHCHAIEHGKADPPAGSLSHKRSLWELIGSYHLAACVHGADYPGVEFNMDAFARDLCAADGHDYDGLVAEMST